MLISSIFMCGYGFTGWEFYWLSFSAGSLGPSQWPSQRIISRKDIYWIFQPVLYHLMSSITMATAQDSTSPCQQRSVSSEFFWSQLLISCFLSTSWFVHETQACVCIDNWFEWHESWSVFSLLSPFCYAEILFIFILKKNIFT